MRVLQITPAFPPAVGGIEQHVFNLSKQLSGKCEAVDVLTTFVGAQSSPAREVSNGFTVYRVAPHMKSNSDLALRGSSIIPQMALKAFRLALKNRYDLVHVHCPFTLMAALPLKYLLGKKIVLTVHGNWVNCVKGRRFFGGKICSDFPAERCSRCLGEKKGIVSLKQRLLGFVASRCDAIIAVSSEVAGSISLRRKPRVEVIPNVAGDLASGLSTSGARKRLGLKGSDRVLLFLGSLVEEKGPQLLLEAFPRILKENPTAKLFLLAGFSDSALESKMNSLVESRGLQGRVSVFKGVENSAARGVFLPAADVVVLPSIWPEPCSSVVTEAMWAAKPVVCSPVGGFTDLVEDGVNGLFFEHKSSEDLSAKINLLLGSRERADSLGLEGLRCVKNRLNWVKASERVFGLYKSVLGGW